jgi:predicted metal-dependent phosphoesterase TrpH
MLIDLQLHSTYSDGYLTPTEVAKLVAQRGVKVASLTDHNTVRGRQEFKHACAKLGIKTIPGLELYVKLNGTRFNLLWYNFRDDPSLHDLLRGTQQRRRNQVRRILQKMVSRGFEFDIDRTLDRFLHYVPVNHLVDELWQSPKNKKRIRADLKLINPREEDIIHAYFYNPRFAVLHESYVDVNRVFHLRKKLGGQLILNHPAKYHYIKKDFWDKLKKLGLDGVELLSPHHSIGAVMHIQQLAGELNLIETGGSDFHKFEKNSSPIKHSWQYFKIDSKYLRGVERVIG